MQSLRENARFVLQQKSIDGQLPHNAEIKIQNGGVKGIAKLIDDKNANENDIYILFKSAAEKFSSIEEFSYSQIMQDISSYQGRRRNKRGK